MNQKFIEELKKENAFLQETIKNLQEEISILKASGKSKNERGAGRKNLSMDIKKNIYLDYVKQVPLKIIADNYSVSTATIYSIINKYSLDDFQNDLSKTLAIEIKKNICPLVKDGSVPVPNSYSDIQSFNPEWVDMISKTQIEFPIFNDFLIKFNIVFEEPIFNFFSRDYFE